MKLSDVQSVHWLVVCYKFLQQWQELREISNPFADDASLQMIQPLLFSLSREGNCPEVEAGAKALRLLIADHLIYSSQDSNAGLKLDFSDPFFAIEAKVWNLVNSDCVNAMAERSSLFRAATNHLEQLVSLMSIDQCAPLERINPIERSRDL
jgi:hypothetical protein